MNRLQFEIKGKTENVAHLICLLKDSVKKLNVVEEHIWHEANLSC